jgi:hypothetical protein
MFTAPELQMREAVSHRHPNSQWKHTASYCKGDTLGKWPIDGVYATPDLPIDASTWLEFMLHLGNHRFNVLDVNAQVFVGDNVLRIIHPLACHLSCNLPKAISAYTKWLMDHMRHHKVLSKLHHLYSTWDGNFTPEQWQQLEALDQIRAEGMLHAEKQCRKLSAWGMWIFHLRWIWQGNAIGCGNR